MFDSGYHRRPPGEPRANPEECGLGDYILADNADRLEWVEVDEHDYRGTMAFPNSVHEGSEPATWAFTPDKLFGSGEPVEVLVREDDWTPRTMITEVISGGRAGAETAALDVALAHGIQCGGWHFAGHESTNGNYELKQIGADDATSADEFNLRDCHGVVVFVLSEASGRRYKADGDRVPPFKRPGPLLPKAMEHPAEKLRIWIAGANVKKLFVTGPLEVDEPGIYKWTTHVLEDAVEFSHS